MCLKDEQKGQQCALTEQQHTFKTQMRRAGSQGDINKKSVGDNQTGLWGFKDGRT